MGVPTISRARAATSVIFAVHGAVTGTFAARVPWVADHAGAGAGELGIALLMPGVGALLAMPISGKLAHRYDLRALTRILILLWCAALILPALPTSIFVLCPLLAVYGAAAGLADVAMNAQAVLIEERYGRSVMSSFHGFWSVGGLAGSAVAAAAARAGLDARTHFLITAVALMAISLAVAPALLSHRPDPTLAEPPAFALPSRAVLPIGLVALCAVFAEGAGLDWSAVYVSDVLEGAASTAALTVSVFSISMALARFAGDRVIQALGPVSTVRLAALCAAIGAVTVVIGGQVVPVLMGFGLLGMGIAVVVPLVFATAGRIGDHPGRSLAGVAGIAYGSGLIAPGIIGGIAHATSLTVSFVVVAALTVAMGLGARAVRSPSPR